MRVDGAPCMGEDMKGKTAINPVDGFFWNNEYVEKFYKENSDAKKKSIPRYFYMSKIEKFDNLHTESGELLIPRICYVWLSAEDRQIM